MFTETVNCSSLIFGYPAYVLLNMHASFHILTLFQSEPGVVKKAVEDAIDAGYRHIDGAHVYGNEKEVGAGIRNKIAEGIVKREDLFITSKLWNTKHKQDAVVPACKNTLADLGLDYLDLYLIHWPFAFSDNDGLFPTKDGKADVIDVDVTETWKGMEECVKLGLAKSIGISNFNSEQIKKVVTSATIKPVTNQVECHPYLNQKQLRELCKQHNIIITAYSPLGNPGSKFNAPGTPNILQDAKLKELAKKHGKSVAQIILRYLIDIGTVPIPKSVTKTRIEENINVFDFKLSPEELAYVDSIDRKLRTCAFDTTLYQDYQRKGGPNHQQLQREAVENKASWMLDGKIYRRLAVRQARYFLAEKDSYDSSQQVGKSSDHVIKVNFFEESLLSLQCGFGGNSCRCWSGVLAFGGLVVAVGIVEDGSTGEVLVAAVFFRVFCRWALPVRRVYPIP
uniref:NADP-dependent oxidoreductase domain-containing protein n=1 Tax=Timema douglasi TaxID=61478 RepID=A0A7R8VE08_TIMDO|nr:unnamed protein product [Timema douglasi]